MLLDHRDPERHGDGRVDHGGEAGRLDSAEEGRGEEPQCFIDIIK